MPVDLSLLSLFSGTPEQIIESRRNTSAEWGKSMTLEEYLQRDVDSDNLEHARDGRLITWYLDLQTLIPIWLDL